ncbi:MAG: hypothetical protein EOP04_18645 [Proteobacteria bacterium]|nr:MAG: hypothetical protein EOP04_18645 [Pseudomonadota bacterium]
MSFKKAILALGLVSGLSNHAFAEDGYLLLNTVNQSQGSVEELKRVIYSEELAKFAGEAGGSGGSSAPGSSGVPSSTGPIACSFCDEGSVNEADDGLNRAFKYLTEASTSLTTASDHLSAYAQGQALNFNFAFGCSYTGDASIDLASADLALGFPKNTFPQWRSKVDATRKDLKDSRFEAGCP